MAALLEVTALRLVFDDDLLLVFPFCDDRAGNFRSENRRTDFRRRAVVREEYFKLGVFALLDTFNFFNGNHSSLFYEVLLAAGSDDCE